MSQQPEFTDFTVEVSMKEKALTGLLFAFGMGGVIYLAHRNSLGDAPPSIYFNLCLALAVFGVVRMVRTIFHENRRGLIAGETYMQVVTLFSKPEIPYADLQTTEVTFTERPAPEISFMWGQFRYRLPCSKTNQLRQLLLAKNIPLIFKDDAAKSNTAVQFKNAVDRSSQPPLKFRAQRPPAAVMLALIFLAVGTVAMFYTAKL